MGRKQRPPARDRSCSRRDQALSWVEMSAEFYLSVAAMLFGIAVVACVIRFGRDIYRSWSREPYLEWWLARLRHIEDVRHVRFDDVKAVMDEYLERRNKFWELFGQVTISVVLVVLLAGLLMMNKIEAAEGLPILSAIVAFVVGKGIGGSGRSGFVGGRGPNEG